MPARSRAVSCLVVVALLVVSGFLSAPAVAAPDARSDATVSSAHAESLSSQVSDGNTTMRLEVQPDGDTEWTITMTQTVSNESDAADLGALATAYEDGDTQLLSLTPFRTAAEQVSTVVGREMEISQTDRTGRATNDTLTLSVSFRWTNFASVSEGEVSVRDVFDGETGRWFGAGTDDGPGLTSNQRLVIIPPDGYDISSVSRDASLQNGTIRWQGPVDFDANSPYAVFTRDVTGPTTTATLTPTQTPTPTPSTSTTVTTDPGPDEESSGLLVPLLVLVVGVAAAAAYVVTRTDAPFGPGEDGDSTAGDDGPTETPSASASEPASDDVSETTTTDGTAPATGAAAADGDDEDDIDEELLSDEERVERLLERNGGRMKQAHIVTETNWSNAKVSQLLSSMAEDGRIEKLRIGRENLISFPEEDITDTDGE